MLNKLRSTAKPAPATVGDFMNLRIAETQAPSPSFCKNCCSPDRPSGSGGRMRTVSKCVCSPGAVRPTFLVDQVRKAPDNVAQGAQCRFGYALAASAKAVKRLGDALHGTPANEVGNEGGAHFNDCARAVESNASPAVHRSSPRGAIFQSTRHAAAVMSSSVLWRRIASLHSSSTSRVASGVAPACNRR
jgi:hypothetical protein